MAEKTGAQRAQNAKKLISEYFGKSGYDYVSSRRRKAVKAVWIVSENVEKSVAELGPI